MRSAVSAAILALAGALALAWARPAAARPVAPRELAKVPVWLLVDLGSGQQLAARDPARRVAPASITKIMTQYVAFEALAAGRLRLSDSYTVSAPAAREWSHRVTGLRVRAGDSLSVDTLLHGIATVSANDAAIVFAEGFGGSVAGFAALMNRQAATLGMRDSRFASPNGWPDGGRTYVSARDLATLAEALIRQIGRAHV